ncbi:MAG: MFS transporter [Actinomycetes bacterium]
MRSMRGTPEQRSWYWYDWANSAYVTVVGTVLFAPYLTSVAERAACGYVGTVEHPCRGSVSLLGLSISAGSLAFYVVTAATILSAFLLPLAGAAADRHPRPAVLLGRFAWAGAAAASLMVLVAGTAWLAGAALLVVANLCLGASLVVYDALLVRLAAPDERDAVSSRGWAFGYLGGGLLLGLDLALVLGHGALGLSQEWAVRLSLLAAGLWWGGFTVVPVRGLRHLPGDLPTSAADPAPLRQSFGQLWSTLRGLRAFPVTLTFLLAYLFFNDGVQTVITAASVYGDKQLGLSQSILIVTILLVQFVAFGGALLFGRLAARFGAKRTIAGSLLAWILVLGLGYLLPAHAVGAFLGLAVLIGIVLGGTQALSRSLFSQLVPLGREAEYFSLYQACERGTSWLGTLVFGLVHQLTGSYRPAIAALVVFFAVGFVLLLRVDVARGRRAAAAEPVALR